MQVLSACQAKSILYVLKTYLLIESSCENQVVKEFGNSSSNLSLKSKSQKKLMRCISTCPKWMS